MSSLIVIIICFLSIIGGKKLFAKWFNPILVYVIPWSIMLVLYEAKLLSYPKLNTETWFIVALAFSSFCAGTLVYFIARKALDKSFIQENYYGIINPGMLRDKEKILKIAIYLMAIIGLFASLQHWWVLLKLFGSIPAILINANVIYKLRIEREIPGMIPYIASFNNAALFLAAVYSGYKKKITAIAFIPFIGIILNEAALVGRVGIFISFLEFFTTYILISFLFVKERKIKKVSHNKFGFVILVVLIIASVSAIRFVRGTIESYAGASSQLNKLQSTEVITPSIYLYFSSHVGILSKYLEMGKEVTPVGSNTFLFFYSVFSKFGWVSRPSDYQRGYWIPMYTNTGTYLREIHADFGYSSIFLIPFLLGIGSTFYWFKFFSDKKLIHLILLVNFFLIIEFSYVLMITRMAFWVIKIIILLILIPFIDRNSSKVKENISG